MQDGGRLTRIFVKHFLYHTHGQIQVVYRTDSTNYELSQKDYRGNVIIYTDESISITESDNAIMQGTIISTKEIYLACNINFAGQLLANQLRIGNTYNGENFRFVKFDPDTIDVKLDKYGGLRENDSTVTIPIELSDTTDINVYFTYCIDLKDGVTVDDFNIPPSFPICNNGEKKTVSIPTGSKVPNIPIQINVKVDTLTEPNDILVLKITDISGAILPNGKTDGELKIKIIDAHVGHVEFDTTKTYKFEENKLGEVDVIKILNGTENTRFHLDSAYTDRYELDSLTGKLTLIGEPLDYEKAAIDVIKVTLTDTGNVSVTRNIPISVIDVNEAPTIDDVTTNLPENLIHPFMVEKLVAKDPDTKTAFTQNVFTMLEGDTSIFRLDSDGELWAKKTFDYETDQKTYTIKVLVQDKNNPSLKDSATVTVNITNSRVLDEPEDVKITEWDKNPPPDTVKTNDPDHEFKWTICEGDSCTTHYDNPRIHKDTTIKVCNDKKTVCDSIVVLFNDAPPVVTLTNAKSTDALIDYITIEEEKDDKIYVNKKDNELKVTVRDTIHKTEKTFPIDVKLDTVHVSSKNVTEYNYLIDESLATYTQIGGGLIEVKEVVKDGDRKITLTKIVNKNMDPIDTVQTVTYTVKQDGKELTITYKTDNLTGQRVSDYEVSYKVDSCTTVSYYLGDDKKITKNKEGNIAFTVSYVYTDDFGNKASSKVDIIYDNIPPKVEILEPIASSSYNRNAIPVKWTVNGEVQDTLTLQRIEKGVNFVVRRYVDKAGNVSADTVMVIMKEAKDIAIEVVNPVTMVDQDKVDEYYSEGHKYNDKKPYDVKFVDPKNDTLPDVIGVGFKVDIVLPSVSPTGSLATLDDITKNGQIPVDDNGNIVGASTHGIPVDQYVEEHCTEEFQKEYKKNGLNIPLYDVTYNLHLWVYTNNANYVNDFNIEFTLNDEAKTTSAGTVQMVIDWLADRDGNVKAKNHHSLGTGAYITKLFSKSVAKHRCDYKDQKKSDKTVKKDDTMKVFGYKRPNK